MDGWMGGWMNEWMYNLYKQVVSGYWNNFENNYCDADFMVTRKVYSI